MKIDARIPHLVNTLLMSIWSLIGYILLNTYIQTDQIYVQLSGAILTGIGAGGALASIRYVLQYWKKPRILEVRGLGIRKIDASSRMAVKPVKRGFALRLVSKSPMLSRFAKSLSQSLSRDIVRSGLTLSPYALSSRFLFYTLIALLLSIPGAIVLAVLVHPALILISAVPAILLFFPRMRLLSLVGDRRRGAEDEIPFFTTYASIMQSVGLSLYNSLESIVGRNIFRHIEMEALMVKRNAQFFFKSQMEALEEAGRTHPNEKMRTLLLGYTSEWRSGGDMAGYLEAKAGDFLLDMRFRWQRYASTAGDIGEVMVSLFFILPILVLTAAFIFPAQTLSLMGLIIALVIPLLTVAVFMVVSGMQPKTYDEIQGHLLLSGLAGGAVFLTATSFSSPLWLSLASGLIASTVFYGSSVVAQMREIGMVEKALPQFLRDVTEYKKMGYDVNKAILKIAEENHYNGVFDNLLRNIARQVSMGLRLGEVELTKMHSWLSRVVFFLLGEIVESGGGTASALETLTSFVSHVNRIKSETKSMMRLYEMLTYITPVGLSLSVAFMISLMTAFSSTIAPGAEVGIMAQIATVPKALTDLTNLMIVTASMSMAIIASRAIDLTAKNSLRIAVNVAIAVVSISLTTVIVQSLMSGLMGMIPAIH